MSKDHTQTPRAYTVKSRVRNSKSLDESDKGTRFQILKSKKAYID